MTATFEKKPGKQFNWYEEIPINHLKLVSEQLYGLFLTKNKSSITPHSPHCYHDGFQAIKLLEHIRVLSKAPSTVDSRVSLPP